jgi:hypothetical protein
VAGYPGNYQLTFNAGVLDFEAQSSYSVVLRARDGAGQFVDQIFTLAVINQNEAPSNLQVAVKMTLNAPNEVIGSLITTDPDSPEQFSYAIVSNPSQAFIVDGVNGAISLTAAGQGLLGSGLTQNLTVQVQDRGGLQISRTFAIKMPDYFPISILPTDNPPNLGTPNSNPSATPGVAVQPPSLGAAQRFRRMYRDKVNALFKDWDILLAPATLICATPIGTEWTELNGVGHPSRAAMGLLTQPISFAGCPVVVAPLWPSVGEGLKGLPMGVQIISAPWREDLALRVAYVLEKAGVAHLSVPTGLPVKIRSFKGFLCRSIFLMSLMK